MPRPLLSFVPGGVLGRWLAVGWCIGASALAGFAAVGAIGHIEPATGIVTLVGPPGDTVVEMLVKEEDEIEAGAIWAHFSGEAAARSDYAAAELAVREADEDGAHTVELARLALEVAQQSLDATETRLNRYMKLEPTSISPQETEVRKSMVAGAKLDVQIRRETWTQAKLGRELAMGRSRNQYLQAGQRLERVLAKTPVGGKVLRIFAVPGGPAGGALIQIADLSTMVVAADVFEGDLAKIKVGSKVRVSSTALPAELSGTVVSIGRMVAGAARVAPVRVKLDQPEPANRYIGMEVNVTIEP